MIHDWVEGQQGPFVMKIIHIQAIALLLLIECTSAHEGHHVKGHENAKSLRAEATLKIEGGKRFIHSNGILSHKTGEFPNRNNPNAIRPQEHRYEVPLKPKKLDQVRDARGCLLAWR